MNGRQSPEGDKFDVVIENINEAKAILMALGTCCCKDLREKLEGELPAIVRLDTTQLRGMFAALEMLPNHCNDQNVIKAGQSVKEAAYFLVA